MTITRKTERQRAIRNAASIAMALSLLGHLLLAAVVIPIWLKKLSETPIEPPTPGELEIAAVYEAPEPVEEIVEQPVVDAQPPAEEKLRPEVASVEPAPRAKPPVAVEPPPAPAEPPPAPIEELSPIILQKPQPSARALLMPSAAAYEEVFAEADIDARERAHEHAKGKRLFKDYERTTAGIKESLSSFGHAVNPGNHTGVDPQSNAYGSYVGMIHNKIHVRWANGYLLDLDMSEPMGSPMNDPTLNTLLEFVIRADDGELEAVNIVRSSGQLRFDAQAIAVAHSTGPHRNPPAELVSPDGRVYVHWNFWRDQRQCGTFGANVFIVSEHGGSPG